MRLGALSFSRNYSYIAPRSVQTQTAPGYRIGEYIEPQDFTYVDLNQYLNNYDSIRARALEEDGTSPAEVIRHKVKVYVYCSPCACQIATALDICQYTGPSPFITFHIRIDYRQVTSCCAPLSGIDGICSVIDHLRDRERNDEAHYAFYPDRIKFIDREWLDQEEYRAEELQEDPKSSRESQILRIVKHHGKAENVAGVVVLGEADYCVPLLGADPFPSIEPGSRARENMMFMLTQEHSGAWHWQRRYLGNYSSKPPIFQNPSKPASIDKRQSEDTSEEKNKRPKTLIAGQ